MAGRACFDCSCLCMIAHTSAPHHAPQTPHKKRAVRRKCAGVGVARAITPELQELRRRGMQARRSTDQRGDGLQMDTMRRVVDVSVRHPLPRQVHRAYCGAGQCDSGGGREAQGT